MIVAYGPEDNPQGVWVASGPPLSPESFRVMSDFGRLD